MVKMDIYDKIRETVKTRMKSWSRCNWPELSLYCGCCKISTGIYIRCVFTVIVTAATIVFNCLLLKALLETRRTIRNTDMTLIKEYLEEATEHEQNLYGMFLVLDGAVAYFLFWINFKIIYIIRNVWTIHALFKNNRKALKILLYVGVPCWIFDGCLSIIGTVLLEHFVKGLLFINFLFEGYNLLAINSKYKEISGKSRIVKEYHLEEPTEIINPYVINPHFETTAVAPNLLHHCRSCTCHVRLNESNCEEIDYRDTVESPTTPVPSNPEADTPEYSENKSQDEELNFKDSPIIYNQEILNEGGHVLMASPTYCIEDNTNRPLRRPNTLALKPIETKEEKKDLCDTPVIYDECQLNVGTSPIIEMK